MPKALVEAFLLLLDDDSLDPALTAAAISLPAASELVDAIPEANPVLLHQVRYEGSNCAARALHTPAKFYEDQASPDSFKQCLTLLGDSAVWHVLGSPYLSAFCPAKLTVTCVL